MDSSEATFYKYIHKRIDYCLDDISNHVERNTCRSCGLDDIVARRHVPYLCDKCVKDIPEFNYKAYQEEVLKAEQEWVDQRLKLIEKYCS